MNTTNPKTPNFTPELLSCGTNPAYLFNPPPRVNTRGRRNRNLFQSIIRKRSLPPMNHRLIQSRLRGVAEHRSKAASDKNRTSVWSSASKLYVTNVCLGFLRGMASLQLRIGCCSSKQRRDGVDQRRHFL